VSAVLRWGFRGITAVQAALVLLQAALAGGHLQGAPLLGAHEMVGTEVLTVVTLGQLVLAVLVWRPGRGPAWPILASLALFGLVVTQIAMGFADLLAVHVPLGLTIFGVSLVLLLVPRRVSA